MYSVCKEYVRSSMHPFLTWLFKEYKRPELMYHPSWVLALEIEAKWINDFPTEGDYYTVAVWLAEHGACMRCKKAFRDAWDNYINDVGQ